MSIIHYICLAITALRICIGVAGKDGALNPPDVPTFFGRVCGVAVSCYVFWYLISGGVR